VALCEKSIPVDLTTFAAIQRSHAKLNVLAQGGDLCLIGLAKLLDFECGFLYGHKPNGVIVLEIGEKLLSLIRRKAVNFLADFFHDGCHSEAIVSKRTGFVEGQEPGVVDDSAQRVVLAHLLLQVTQCFEHHFPRLRIALSSDGGDAASFTVFELND
jgi:hypothetical protein